MGLFLFTNFFPFNRAEPFLVNEFNFTKEQFDHITILALYGNKKDSILGCSESIEVLKPVMSSPSDKFSLLLKGVFNLAPLNIHFQEFFSCKIFLSPSKAYWFFISLLITRAALSSHSYKFIVASLKKNRHSVLYFYWGDNLCWILPYLKKDLNSETVMSVIRFHRTDIYEELKASYAPLRGAIFNAADLLVPISLDGEKYLLGKYPAFKNKIQVSRLGVFDHGMNPYVPGTKKIIVSVSAIVKVKRVHLIMQALQKTGIEVCWHHFGDGPLMSSIMELTRKSGVNLQIHLHGHVDNSQVMNFYKTQSIDLFINVSESEGLPVSIMEALSFGIPVIATETGGTPELVNDSCGKLVSVDLEPARLVEEIESILNLSGEKFLQKRKAARDIFEQKADAKRNYKLFYELLYKTFAEKRN